MSSPKPIALIGNHTPRQCGIATFTSDLAAAIDGVSTQACCVVAMNDRPEGYRYPERVRFEIQDGRLPEYRLAAELLNMNSFDVACLQHEYGIFGGVRGSHVLELLSGLRMPVVSTLHTVLAAPSHRELRIVQEIARLSDRVVVMADRAATFLRDIYDVPPGKIRFVPHGIPDLPFVDPSYYKDLFGVEGRKVLLTFGLVSPGKGIEYSIRALPTIVARHPDVVYVIVGATHPHVRRDQGEAYRLHLQGLARELGVEDNVVFHNRFVELSELCEYLGAADIYLTPYLSETQIVSGTLAYALGAGKAVVSTPYWYAEEMLANGRGRLVPFRDADAIAREVIALLDDPVEAGAMRKRAYTFCRGMVWSEVGRAYLRIFDEARQGRPSRPTVSPPRLVAESPEESLPDVRLAHLLTLTDDTGLLQHARFAVPDRRHGYCTDDNARALIVALGARGSSDNGLEKAMRAYMSFLDHAFNPRTGRFRNFMTYDRRWLEEAGSEDSHGRAVWALGLLVAQSERDWEKWFGMTLLKRALEPLAEFAHPRSWAFAMLGLYGYLERFGGDREAAALYDTLANALHMRFLTHATADWPWFEDIVTYDNARVPQALMQAGIHLKRADMVETAVRSLQWLVASQTGGEGHFQPVGNRGWWRRGREKARFDQQSLEAGGTTEACLDAYALTGDPQWLLDARLCFDWFLGRNDVRVSLCDLMTGGCKDGLNPEDANQNQGAESTLSWLMAQVAWQRRSSESVHVRSRWHVEIAPSGRVPVASEA